MTIRDRILARADLDPLRVARDLDGLAAALNAEGLTVAGERYVTMRTILAECPSGHEIVVALRTAAPADPIVDESVNFLRKDSGFDVGHPNARPDLDRLVAAGVLTAGQRDELLALALRPLIVTRLDVADEMFNPDGTEK
ncbi:hypothetical protein AB595_04760 [Massilia sp. WF1]|uniref:hypothetical protein n=1 Tax=unclassified Massilia TaxID=2609279 RepID=UPI00064A02A3|nr:MULTISPECIES: hypothetical protein [unclassified Massilia]ALK96986.1 hypothetical protein AM586_12670 [Massilia sp. WG5]KLU37936.1 hypothetical protein AB595_04760 [Massilia sp. WF1]